MCLPDERPVYLVRRACRTGEAGPYETEQSKSKLSVRLGPEGPDLPLVHRVVLPMIGDADWKCLVLGSRPTHPAEPREARREWQELGVRPQRRQTSGYRDRDLHTARGQ